ncbi:glycosyltransferase family 2 protein [Thermodesulfobacteriota bacterium]
MNIDISIIIPLYNRSKTIGTCLDSILNQTYQNFEIIVVDDCSSDSSVDTVRSFNDKRIRLIALNANSGAQAARNKGIKESSNDWIAFQDSDDEWDSQKLEYQVRALSTVNFDPMTVVYTDCWRHDHLTGQNSIWNLPHINGKNVIAKALTSPGPMFQGILTSKSALEKIGLLDEKVPSYQEWDTSIRLAKTCQFIHRKEPLFTYHLHSGATISRNKELDIDGYQYVVDKFRDEIISFCGEDTYNRHIISNAIKALRWNLFDRSLNVINKCSRKNSKYYILKIVASLRVPGLYLTLTKLNNLIKKLTKS